MSFIVPQEPRQVLEPLVAPWLRSATTLPGGPSAIPFFWARNAIYHGLRALGVGPGDRVLAPAYHCRTAIEPLVGAGADVDFYDVGPDGSADLEKLGRLRRDRTRALLTIHYFGFPQPIAALRRWCDDAGLFLIEDCAHVLAGEADGAPLGSFGDVSVFSPRKLFPLHDGGTLVLNRPGAGERAPTPRASAMLELKAAKNVVERWVDEAGVPGGGLLRGLLRLPARLGRGMARGHAEDAPRVVDAYDPRFDAAAASLGMTAVSRRILACSDMARAVERRRTNYLRLDSLLGAVPGVEPMFARLPDGACPMVFPARAPGRRDFHRVLRRHGLPATAWDGVIHPALPIERFPGADLLYHEVLFLPVHQDLAADDPDRIAGAVRSAIGAARAVS